MEIRERIREYLNVKGISKYRFYQEIEVSNGFLDKGGGIGSDKCEKICYQYPDINTEWLLTGKGEMLKTEEAKPPPINQTETHINDPLVNRLFDTIEKKDLKIEELLKENARLGEQLRLIDAKKTDTGNIAGSVSTKSNLSRISQRATSAGVHLKE